MRNIWYLDRPKANRFLAEDFDSGFLAPDQYLSGGNEIEEVLRRGTSGLLVKDALVEIDLIAGANRDARTSEHLWPKFPLHLS
jgi:hypothetical protein